MKKHCVVSLLALLCSPAWAAGTSDQAPQTGWQSAAVMGGMPAQSPVPVNTPPANTPPTAQNGSSAGTTSGGQQNDGSNSHSDGSRQSDDLPLPSPMYQAAQQQTAPLSPGEVRSLRGEHEDINRALKAPTMTVVPRISAQTVDLSPGASLPLVRAAVNYTSNVSFTDATGAPWPLGAPALLANDNDFAVYSIPGGPILTIQAKHPYATGSITVYLKGLSVPVVLTVSSGETDSKKNIWTVDSRLDLRIPRRGPQAQAMAAPESKIGLYDNALQAFLDGTPPAGAQRLKISGGVPDTTVWQMGDDLYIRSRADVMDEFDQTLSSADGMHLWKMPVTPYVTFSVMGRAVPLNITLE